MISQGPYKILFIGNDASRSGAPIVLLHLLNWLKTHTNLQFDILLLNDGPLKSDFKHLADTYVLTEMVNVHSYTNRFRKKVFKADPGKKLKKAVSKLAKQKYHLIYGNTILSMPWLKMFRQDHGFKTLCCIHELSFALNYCFDKAFLTENLNLTDGIIAVSKAVKTNLIETYRLPETKVSLHYEFIDTAYPETSKQTQRAIFDLPQNDFVIGSGGTPEWRKGVDMLIPLALHFKENYPDFKFRIVWLGAGDENNTVKQLLFDIEKAGLTHQLSFIKNINNPLDAISTFDVFISLSREDPFPLIALEAAFLQKPVIAFENSGGIPELLEEGAGFTAPYLAVDKAADVIYKLSNDVALLKGTGAKGRELIETKYNTGKVAPEIYKEIINLIEGKLS